MKHKNIQKITKLAITSLWHTGKPRIAMSKLYLPKERGRGANFPNIRVYNLSCLLRTGLDWILQVSKYINYYLVSALVHPYNLSALLHSYLKSIPDPIKHNLLF